MTEDIFLLTGQFESPGLGFLRLHSTFRHDLKIYASDEGRVQMTAAAFTKVCSMMMSILADPQHIKPGIINTFNNCKFV